MKKIIILIFMVLCSMLFLGGCADVSYGVSINQKGQISQSLIVKPDYEELEKYGYDKNTINERIITLFNDSVKNQTDKFKTYKVLTIPQSVKTDVLSRVKHSYCFLDDGIKLEYNFESYSDYVYYYCLVDESLETNNDSIKKNFLFYYNETISNNIFSSIEGSNLESYIKDVFGFNEDFKYSMKDLSYEYSYSLPDKKQHSNADSVTYDGNLYTHTWKFSGNNLDKKIRFYSFTQIITSNWYYLALLISIVFFVILLIINECIEIKKKKNSIKGEKIKNESTT